MRGSAPVAIQKQLRMSYRLKKEEPLAAGIRRLAREQLEQALGEIKAVSHEDGGAAVFATRKHIKRTRALLRLAAVERHAQKQA